MPALAKPPIRPLRHVDLDRFGPDTTDGRPLRTNTTSFADQTHAAGSRSIETQVSKTRAPAQRSLRHVPDEVGPTWRPLTRPAER